MSGPDWSALAFYFESRPRTRQRPPQRQDDAPDPDQQALVDSLEPSLFDADDERPEPPAARPEWRGVRPWARGADE